MAKQELTFTGHFTLDLAYEGLEAILSFTSGTPQDKPWSMAEVTGLLQSGGVSFGYKADEAQKALAVHAQKKDKQFSLVIARGTAPVATTSEECQLVECPVPDAWAPAVHLVLSTAPEPEIQKEVQYKVEKEKTIVTKGALPFLPGKEELVKVYEKETRFEKVKIDPRVKVSGFIEEGKKLGQVLPSKQGQPGKSVKGEVINPVNPPETSLFIGGNVHRKGPELTAMVTGIVRLGSNWIDIIPFESHKLTLTVSDDKASLFLDYQPGHPRLPSPQYSEILAQAKDLGFDVNMLIPEHDMVDMIHKAVEEGLRIEHHPITLPEDSFFDITVSDDKLKAVLNVSKGSGHGKQLVLKEVGSAINASKIKLTDREKVKKDILDFFGSSERALIGYVLAEGQAPVEPPRQGLTWSCDFLEKKDFEKLQANLAKGLPEGYAAYPLAKLSALAQVEKEQRVGALGPVVVGTPGMDVFGQSSPGKPSPALEVKLMGALETAQTFFVAKKNGLLLKAEDEAGTLWLALVEHSDSMFKVEVSDGGMAAYLHVDAHRGTGKPVVAAEIKAEIQKLGIKKGLLDQVLGAALEAAAKGEDIVRLCIAQGKEALGGASSRVEILVAQASQAVRIRADGTADYKNRDNITTVKKDTPLARILPPDHAPESGWDIFGKEIKATVTGGPEWDAGQNVRKEVQTDGSTLLLADADGEFRKEKGKLEVVAGYTVKGNIDGVTGNIKFPGTVQVTGDVMSGFYIMAGGDIKIAGSVEASLLSSDQDIMIAGGVKGGGKALLRAKRSILATFIEQSTVLGIGDIKIKKSILRSTVKCNARLIMADDAQLIGGETKVKSGLQVGMLGSDKGIPTKVVFGSDILIEDQIEVEAKEIIKLQDDITSVNTAMKQPDKISNKEIMQELFNNKLKFMKMLEKRNLRLFSLKEKYEQHHPSEIIIKGTLFPGVTIESHGRIFEVHSPKAKLRIGFDTTTGRITEAPWDGKS